MEVTYYPIDETMARLAHDANSFRDYRKDLTTNEYRAAVDAARALAEQEAEKRPEHAGEIEHLLDRYASKLATWYNDSSRNEASCPSVMIAGASNFPVRKKEKQNARRDTLSREYDQISAILDKIKTIGTGGIQSGDINAIKKLEAKLEALQESHQRMKDANAYWRKHKTLDGCPVLSEETIEQIKADMERFPWHAGAPYAAYELQLSNAEIKRVEGRIAELKAAKERGNVESEVEGMDGLTLKENTEKMRVQLIFDDKPDPEEREILKANGFRWAPSEGAWQRQLTANGRDAAQRVIREIKKLGEKE